ncbi:hypothetical protein D1007_24560 [Hordeum vulgare]|uniref:uncharacterized protein LOC123396010 n=1 Tax=Hordeum vulgare subsp. vulgare TaxID=112509 RepID=UPI000B47A92E|nr:uncharacterized protein LOC123396010 [Hordeum vulgare subsp. vulgare]KAE8800080.1 hypothetical protein D1007_24560 [Hordeum vulgare]
MPSTLKRPSLGRLLASLRSPSRVPVQTGFPTFLADLVVKNHARLRNPRKPRSHTAQLALPPSPAETPVVVEGENPSLPPSPEPPSPVAVEPDSSAPVARPLDDAPKGAAFLRPRPQLLALGGAVALALLAVWSEGTVAVLTVASLSLLWIESACRRRSGPEELPDSGGRAPVSPIRQVEEAPRSSSCSDSDKSSELVSGGEDPATPKRKAKRSLRKIISKTLQKKKPKAKGSGDGEVVEQPDGAGPTKTEAFLILAPSTSTTDTEEAPSEPSTESSVEMKTETERRGDRFKFPLAAFVAVILAGLAAGKLPATALAVLCVAFFFGARRRACLGRQ